MGRGPNIEGRKNAADAVKAKLEGQKADVSGTTFALLLAGCLLFVLLALTITDLPPGEHLLQALLAEVVAPCNRIGCSRLDIRHHEQIGGIAGGLYREARVRHAHA